MKIRNVPQQVDAALDRSYLYKLPEGSPEQSNDSDPPNRVPSQLGEFLLVPNLLTRHSQDATPRLSHSIILRSWVLRDRRGERTKGVRGSEGEKKFPIGLAHSSCWDPVHAQPIAGNHITR